MKDKAQEKISSIHPKPQVSTSLSTNRFKTLFFIFLFLITVIGLVFISVQTEKKQITNRQPVKAQPTSIPSNSTVNPMVNWKTYTSTKLGFSIKYPNGYSLPQEGENYLSLISPLNPNRGRGYELQSGELKIDIYTEAVRETSLMECWNEHNASEAKILNQSEVVIDGIKTTSLNFEGAGSTTGQFICLYHNNKRYLIMKYPLETTRQSEFIQILSALKF